MKLASRALLAAAERAAAAGQRPALLVWRRLAAAEDPALVTVAVLRGLDAAIALAERGVLVELAARWPSAGDGAEEGVFSALRALWAAGFEQEAAALAKAEAVRRPSARAFYDLGMCGLPPADAIAAFREAQIRAEREGDRALARAAKLRELVLRFGVPAEREAVAQEASALDATDASEGETLALARILLSHGSRFVRARAIGLLDPIASAGGARSRRALAILAAHVDHFGDHLSSLELERARAVLAREGLASFGAARTILAPGNRFTDAGDDGAMRSVLRAAAEQEPELRPLHARAEDLVSGRFEAHRAAASAALEDRVLDAAFALRDEAWPLAVARLEQLCGAVARASFVGAGAWAVADHALAVSSAEVREVGASLVFALLERGDAVALPARGWLPLSRRLLEGGREELGLQLLRRAHALREPGAADALGDALRRSAYRHADAKRPADRLKALERLREARALLRRDGASR